MKKLINIDEAQSSKINYIKNIKEEFKKLKELKNDDMQILLDFDGLDINTINDIINGFIISLAPTNSLLKERYFMFIENLTKVLKDNGLNDIQYLIKLEELLKDTYITIIIEE